MSHDISAELGSTLQHEGAKALQATEARNEFLITTSQIEGWLGRADQATSHNQDDTSAEVSQAMQVIVIQQVCSCDRQ